MKRAIRRQRIKMRYRWWSLQNWRKGYKWGSVQRYRCCDHTTPFHYAACAEREVSV